MGILIKNNIVNQKGTPAFYESSLATRPIANIQGRMFIDTDVPSTGIYRDNGTSWNQVADFGAGTTGTLQQVTTNGSTTNVGISITTLTTGSILFSGTNGLISQDNTNLFWDDTNNFLGIGPTGGPSALLDIHSATQNIFIQLNATSTNNSNIAFLNNGVGKWRIGNVYNSGANDFIIYDTTNSLSRLTIKNTGQTFIGSDTTSSGLLVVNSATSDNHLVLLGANAPSIRLRNAGTGGSLNAGIGISTATNNFIQGSASGNYCFFNSSTTASPILFGIYDSGVGNTVEAARISAARNFLVGGVSDSGQKLQITGTALITGNITANFFTASAVNSIFTTVSSGTAAQYAILATNTGGSSYFGRESSTGGTFSSDPYSTIIYSTGNYPIDIFVNSTLSAIWSANGNLTLGNTAGTGLYNLFANSATFRGTVAISNTVTAAVAVASTHKVSILINGVQYYLLATNV
jgi:hypothetical protein